MIFKQSGVYIQPGLACGGGDMLRRLHPFGGEACLCREIHELSARAANIDQATIGGLLTQQTCDRLEAATGDFTPAFRLVRRGLVKSRRIEGRHGFPVTRFAGGAE